MFENIGSKLMGLAKTIFVLLLIAAIVGGIALSAINTALSIIVIILGLIMAWISVLTLYGFGRLIDDTSAIREAMSSVEQKSNREDIPAEDGMWICRNCGTQNPDNVNRCPNCYWMR